MLRCIIFIGLFGLCSCTGYHLGSTKPAKYDSVKSLAIPHFKNDTLTPRVSTLVTNSTIDTFAQDGTYAIRSVSQADATLFGTISEINYTQFRANRFDTLASDELKVEVRVKWQLIQNNTILAEGVGKGSTTFNVVDNLSISRQNALPLAASRAAQNIATQLSVGF